MESEIICTRDIAHLLTASPQKNDYYTVVLCLKGNVSVKIGYHRFMLEAQKISILAPDIIYSIDQASPDFEAIQLCFRKSFLQKIYLRDEIIHELLETHPDYPPVFGLEASFATVLDKYKQIERELDKKSAYHLDMVRLMVIELLYEYNRACEYCLLGFKKNMNRNYQLTYQFKRLVDAHFMEWRGISEYAVHLGITAKHLTEVIKAETGSTALQLIHERLILESQYLLKHTTHSVKECAYQLGFETASYFTRFFKNNTGISPNEYRQEP